MAFYTIFSITIIQKINKTFLILQPFTKNPTQWQQYFCEFSEVFNAGILYRIPVNDCFNKKKTKIGLPRLQVESLHKGLGNSRLRHTAEKNPTTTLKKKTIAMVVKGLTSGEMKL